MTPPRRRQPVAQADPAEERTPDERQIDRFVRASSFQLLTPILITILMAVGGWWLTTNVGTWTFVLISSQTPAPPGTRSVSIQINIFGTTSGAPVAHIDDVQMAVA